MLLESTAILPAPPLKFFQSRRQKAYRNGYYERDFVTVLGTLRLRIERTRGQIQLEKLFELDKPGTYQISVKRIVPRTQKDLTSHVEISADTCTVAITEI